MDITAIERNVRLYGLPVFLTLMGLAGMLLIGLSSPATTPIDHVLAPLKRAAFLGAAGFAVVGAIWWARNAWLKYRWIRGELDGGCHHCGGVMRQLKGRWGAYSKCLMCGNTRKGWH
ncbi:hypothetical protein SA496_14350 [Pseudomonas sp. JS3066]|uniref:hypothetical protein n=1 Tax=Pseudomonas sp. JS3066 TaxID=3090665 RepID=UPI002E7B822A|nr:hypothetical protein [Pseudomonas sp. JS3066]WVK90926.1 hypothetical protein SA496_14350 [Pseudomonas sp. JS3066]